MAQYRRAQCRAAKYGASRRPVRRISEPGGETTGRTGVTRATPTQRPCASGAGPTQPATAEPGTAKPGLAKPGGPAPRLPKPGIPKPGGPAPSGTRQRGQPPSAEQPPSHALSA